MIIKKHDLRLDLLKMTATMMVVVLHVIELEEGICSNVCTSSAHSESRFF